MKKLLMIVAVIAAFGASAKTTGCKDKNFNGLEDYTSYDKLQYYKRFSVLYSGDSPPPIGYEDTFGTAGSHCYATNVAFIKHYSGKVYAMYTTHDDFCDGGNTIGVVIDMDLYGNGETEKAIVAEIGDSELVCL